MEEEVQKEDTLIASKGELDAELAAWFESELIGGALGG